MKTSILDMVQALQPCQTCLYVLTARPHSDHIHNTKLQALFVAQLCTIQR